MSTNDRPSAYSEIFSHCFVKWYAPNDTRKAQADRRRFIRALKKLAEAGGISASDRGYTFVPCRSAARAETELRPLLPPDGELRIIGVTDKQLEKSSIAWGERRKYATTGGVAPNAAIAKAQGGAA